MIKVKNELQDIFCTLLERAPRFEKNCFDGVRNVVLLLPWKTALGQKRNNNSK